MTMDVAVKHSSAGSQMVAARTLEVRRSIAATGTGQWYLSTVHQLLSVIDELLPNLPPPMSESHVADLRTHYPPLSASEDPATLEFESG